MNFATWTNLALTTFSLSMEYQGLNAKAETGRELFETDASFKGGYIAWPLIQRKLAIGIGIIPLVTSDFGLKIENVGIGAPATQSIQSKGTISDVKFVLAYRLSSNLSLSVAPTFNFGVVTDELRILYDDIAYGDILIKNRYQVHGFGVDIGAYYQMTSWLGTGLKVRTPTRLTVNTEQISQTVEKTLEGYNNIQLPLAITMGAVIKFSSRFLIGMDVDYQNWRDGYEVNDRRILSMQNSFRAGAGFQRGPSHDRFAPYFQRMTLRGGAFYGQLNKTSNGSQIHEYGLTFGVGLPIILNRNRVDISTEIGRRGDKSMNFIEEMYFKLNFSISTNELWFVQQDR